MPAKKLAPGLGFHLEGDGKWDVQKIPEDILQSAQPTGELEIEGFPSSVFETPDGDQWAQKSPGIPAPKGDDASRDIEDSLGKMASRLASGR